MFKKIFKAFILIFTLFITVSLTGCDLVDSVLNIVDDSTDLSTYTYNGIIIEDVKSAYFTIEENVVLTPKVYKLYTKEGEYDVHEEICYDFIGDNTLDTSKPGKYTYTLDLNVPDINHENITHETKTFDVYVIDFKLQDGIYCDTLLNNLYYISHKIEDDKLYSFNYETKSFDTEAWYFEEINELLGHEVEYHGEIIESYENPFCVTFSNSEGEEMSFLEFIVVDGEIQYIGSKPYDYSNVVQITTLESNYFQNIPFVFIKQDDKLSQDQLNSLNSFGSFYLDKEKTQALTNETIISSNEIYFSINQEDYSDKPFLGEYSYEFEYYTDVITINGDCINLNNEINMPYKAIENSDGWQIITIYESFQYYSKNNNLVISGYEDEIYTRR